MNSARNKWLLTYQGSEIKLTADLWDTGVRSQCRTHLNGWGKRECYQPLFASFALKEMFKYPNRKRGFGERDANKWEPQVVCRKGDPSCLFSTAWSFQRGMPKGSRSRIPDLANYRSKMAVKETQSQVIKALRVIAAGKPALQECGRGSSRLKGRDAGRQLGAVLEWRAPILILRITGNAVQIWFRSEAFWYQQWSSISAFPVTERLHTNRSQK